MCDPLTIAGAVLSIGSAAANSFANASATRARNDALAAERIRQQGLDQEAAALNVASQDRFQDFEGQQDAKGQSLAEFYQQQADETPAALAEVMPESQSGVTVAEEARQRAKARGETDARAVSLGNLRSFGDVLGGISLLQARDAGSIGQIGGFKTGSNNVLPYELDAASQKGAGLRLLGDVLGGAGSVAIGAGLTGGGGAGLPAWASKSIPAVRRAALNVGARGGANSAVRLGSLFGRG